MKKTVVIIKGGIGKNIMFTAVARSLSIQLQQRITVVTHWPLVYHGLEFIDEVWQLGPGMANFYDKHRDSTVLNVEPYLHKDYISHGRHLIDVWCEMLGCEWDNSPPEIHIFSRQYDQAKAFCDDLRKTKPVAVTQFFGGPMGSEQGKPPAGGQVRSIPPGLAQLIANDLSDQYHVLNICVPNQPQLEGVTPLTDDLRVVMACLKCADRRIVIDSFANHACAAMAVPATVMWGATDPKVLGYEHHNNVMLGNCPTPNCMRPYGWLFDIQAGGVEWSCPHDEICVRFLAEDLTQSTGLTDGEN